MPNDLISTALAGGLILSLLGFSLAFAAHKPGAGSALLGAGLFLWTTGLYFAAPLIRIIAFGMFAAAICVAVPLALVLSLKSIKRRRIPAYLLIIVASGTTGVLVDSNMLNRLWVAPQSPALISAGVWFAAASVILIAFALALALALSPSRAQSARG